MRGQTNNVVLDELQNTDVRKLLVCASSSTITHPSRLLVTLSNKILRVVFNFLIIIHKSANLYRSLNRSSEQGCRNPYGFGFLMITSLCILH